MRGRSYSYSPSPPRGYNRRLCSPSPKSRYRGGRGRDLPTSLLVRNLHRDCRPEDLRRPFGRFGPLKDIYLPRDYYTGVKFVDFNNQPSSGMQSEPRGFGFVQYVDPADAADAKYHMDGQILFGRELTVLFAEESRKKPSEMRARYRIRGRAYDYRRSPLRYSPLPRHALTYCRSPEYSPPPRRSHYSRSISPSDRAYRQRSYSGSPYRSRSYSPTRSRS